MQQIKSFPSKKDFAYNSLQNAILKGELKPGAQLTIDELARELGVSQIPIREALQQLQAERFVTIEPYVGARVTELDAGLIDEVFDLLEAMEVISSRAACQHMTETDFAEIELCLKELDMLTDDPDRFSEENIRLHQLICDRAGMQLVKQMMIITMVQWDRLRRYYLTDVFASRIREAQQEHWQILDALRKKDPDLVEKTIRLHNKAAREAYMTHLKIMGQLPDKNQPAT